MKRDIYLVQLIVRSATHELLKNIASLYVCGI